jgi:MoxR-like ATPase
VPDLMQVLQTSLAEIERVIVGQKETIRHAVAACMAGGHVLLEDVPGTGKTTLAFTLATVFGLSFTRVQGTPDLLPGDIIGSSVYQPQSGTFKFCKGPIFTQLLLMDEINRATPRTQAALLEAMAERQVSAEGETHFLDDTFFVIATANPLESQGVFPLPEAQIDRFLISLQLGYGSEEEELQMIERVRLSAPVEPLPQMTKAQILELRKLCKEVTVATEIARYIVRLCRETRNHESIVLGASPRSILMLTAFSQSLALIHGRDYVIPDDVKEAWFPVMRHRLHMHVEWRMDGPAQENQDVLAEILNRIKTPGEHFIEV